MARRPRPPEPAESGPMARKIDREHRVALPPPVMRFLGVKPGGYVAFEVEDGQVVLHAAEVARVVKVKRKP